MAEESGQEKTEEPTGKRLEEFKAEGQIAKTPEVTALLVIVTAMVTLSSLGPSMGHSLAKALEASLKIPKDTAIMNSLLWMKAFALPVFKDVFILFGFLVFVSVAGSLLQTGIVFAEKALKPKFNNINPFTGIARLFSMRMIVQFLKSFLKVFVIGLIVYSEINAKLEDMVMTSSLPLTTAFKWTVSLLGTLVLKISLFLATVSVADYLYQWYTLRQQMMMTKQEVKDEYKESELPAHVKQKVKQVATERSKRSIQKEVPKADVIITNPSHYAVAIRYKRFEDKAPRVVAKGKDLLAATIRKVAQDNNVPFYEYPELARSLYRSVKVGRMIPFEFYETVARVLAFIYKIHRERHEVRA